MSARRTAAASIPLDKLCRATGLPMPLAEYCFALMHGRQWRFDWAWPAHKVALEIEGGTWVKGGGRHQRRDGFIEDMEKYNRAALDGWRVFRVMPMTMASAATLELLSDALLHQPPLARELIELRASRDALLGAAKLGLEVLSRGGGDAAHLTHASIADAITAAEVRRKGER